MTDLSKALREQLSEVADLKLPDVISVERSADGTRKWLLDVGGAQAVETVFIPEPRRATLCISSQAGCALDCAFCATGEQGFNRNLSIAEILGQVVLASLEIAPVEISNVVFMGMGEPLANYANVVPVAKLLIDDRAFGLSRRRVTISTAGLVPQITRLPEECNVALAVSLHAPNDELRDRLVPINRIHPIGSLLDGVLAVRRRSGIAPDHFRVRDARPGQRQPGACARSRPLAAGSAGQGQSDSVQLLARLGFSLFLGGLYRNVLAGSSVKRHSRDDQAAARRRHRCRVRSIGGPYR